MTADELHDASLPGLPPEKGIAQLCWLIQHVAAGDLPVQTLISNFRVVYEDVERSGRPQYRSKEEARLVWDVLWVLEFYSPDPTRESDPSEWNSAAGVLAVVQDAARRLEAL
jgi:hypothetical protein